MNDTPRRAHGDLEGLVLRSVWNAGRPVSPADVIKLIDAGVAYTTVMTVLMRLWEKGLLHREREGRAYHYRPAIAEAALAANRMETALRTASDRDDVLTRFVGALPADDVAALRRLVGGTTPEDGS